MNRKQKICLWIGIIAFAFVGLISVSDIYFFADISRLLIRWVIIGVITSGLIYSFKDKKPKDKQKQ